MAPSAPAPGQFPMPAAPQLAVPQGPAPKKLSMFLKVSIILLIGLTLASISLLFIGDFEGRFERVFSTFALFAVFVVLTAIDTSREKRNDWYAPVALIANTYILGLLLIVIWMTPYRYYSLLFDIVWKSILVIVLVRLVIICCELLLRSGQKSGEVTNRFAFATSILAVLSGIMFTAPIGFDAFGLRVPDMYWKIATAVLILTALGLSVTLLLRWAGKSDARAEHRAAVEAAQAEAFRAAATANAGGSSAGAQQGYPAALPQQAAQAQDPAPQDPAQQPSDEEEGLLPWPTFADGRPIPAGPDGQPDFSVPGAPRPPQA